MFSIEYIWTAVAVTQALITSFQVGTQLLLPQKPSVSSSTTLPSLVPVEATTNTTNVFKAVEESDMHQSSSSAEGTSERFNDGDTDDEYHILNAFQLAVRMGLLNIHSTTNQTTMELLSSNHKSDDDDDDNHVQYGTTTTTTTTLPDPLSSTVIARRRGLHRRRRQTFGTWKSVYTFTGNGNIPYRMSLVPAVDDTHDPSASPTMETSSSANSSIENHTNAILEDEKSERYCNEYYETQYTLQRSTTRNTCRSSRLQQAQSQQSNHNKPTTTTTTTAVRIRAYAPQLFRQLHSYYIHNSTSTQTATNDFTEHNTQTTSAPLNDDDETLLQQQFATSILHRSYTFFKTNSKGSQRTKNIFFYTNTDDTTPPPNRTTNNRRSSVFQKQREMKSVYPPNYLIKSIKEDEFHTLFDTILTKYVRYMEQYGSITLLNRIYGIYEIIIDHPEQNDMDNIDNNVVNVSNQHHGNNTTTTTAKPIRTTKQRPPQKYYLIVLNAVFDPSLMARNCSDVTSTTVKKQASAFEVYDLKGSIVGRRSKLKADSIEDDNVHDDLVSSTESKLPTMTPPTTTYKDLDFILDVENGSNTSRSGLIQIGSMAKRRFLQQLRRDVTFLTSCSVMDYSLLIGIESSDMDRKKIERKQLRNIFWKRRRRHEEEMEENIHYSNSRPLSIQCGTRKGRPVKYYFGVIDFLQPFNYKKEIEYRYKGLIYERNTYSCIPPDLYAQRFLDFIDKYVA
jgi:Phosphatidylinositol-4-phosphate 5-Kinase